MLTTLFDDTFSFTSVSKKYTVHCDSFEDYDESLISNISRVDYISLSFRDDLNLEYCF